MRSHILWVSLSAVWVLATSSGSALAGVTPVPEPSSMALLAVGLGGAAWVKFRRRK